MVTEQNNVADNGDDLRAAIVASGVFPSVEHINVAEAVVNQRLERQRVSHAKALAKVQDEAEAKASGLRKQIAAIKGEVANG